MRFWLAMVSLVVFGPSLIAAGDLAQAAKKHRKRKAAPAPATTAPANEDVIAETVTLPTPAAAPTNVTLQAPTLAITRPRLAVLGFEGEGISEQDLRTLEDGVSSTAASYTKMDVIAAADMRAMVNLGSKQQIMGCDEKSCLTEFGSLLAVQQLLSGTVQPLGDGYQLTLRLLDLTNGRPLKNITFKTTTREMQDVVVKTNENVPALFGVVGRIAIWNQPEQGEVFLNDRFVGKTPVSYISVSTAGEHRLSIEGPAITRWETQIEIAPGQDLRIRALSQSLALLEKEAKERRKFGYWTGAGAFVSGIACGVMYALAARSDASLQRIDRRRAEQADLDRITGNTATYALTSLGFGLIAAGLGGVSGYALVVNPAQDTLDANR